MSVSCKNNHLADWRDGINDDVVVKAYLLTPDCVANFLLTLNLRSPPGGAPFGRPSAPHRLWMLSMIDLGWKASTLRTRLCVVLVKAVDFVTLHFEVIVLLCQDIILLPPC